MTRRALIPPLGTLCLVGLAAFLGLQAANLDPRASSALAETAEAPRTEHVTQDITTTPDPTGSMPIAFDAAILERPLFHPTRRPVRLAPKPEPVAVRPAKPEPQPVVAPPEPPRLILRGVLLQGPSRRALLDSGSGDADWVEEGREIEGWILGEIGPGHVVLRAEDQEHRIDLYE